jgi:hypothetical protein
MKGTIYGTRQPRGTQVKKGWELLVELTCARLVMDNYEYPVGRW